MSDKPIFTVTAALTWGLLGAIAFLANITCKALLPRNASWQDRVVFLWLAFDGAMHFALEGPFLYLSTFGRTINTSTSFFTVLWRDYTYADARFGVADPGIVSLEILSVLFAGPLCFYIIRQMVKNDLAYHYWIIVLCTAELYGGWMVFCPEWLAGSPNLDTSNAMYLWVYLVLMNVIWIVVPLWLMFNSYGHIASSLRRVEGARTKKKT